MRGQSPPRARGDSPRARAGTVRRAGARGETLPEGSPQGHGLEGEGSVGQAGRSGVVEDRPGHGAASGVDYRVAGDTYCDRSAGADERRPSRADIIDRRCSDGSAPDRLRPDTDGCAAGERRCIELDLAADGRRHAWHGWHDGVRDLSHYARFRSRLGVVG